MAIDPGEPPARPHAQREVSLTVDTPCHPCTPVAEPIVYQTFANPLGEVCNTPWPNSYRSLQDFCSRAWCRLEVLLCATLPLRDGGFR